ncbi:hypothetical protein C5F61_13205 [Photobacterium damselae subsp. damselae]|uniref:DUF2971 domain-containing protein n=1 Tax=Photobacterium damselae TaxID=38293 RepID=UPI000D057164|nr:DUF2971 domain-containing protein [Photobacterium damselae]PSB77101.1 hypothetical protein C5F61_13205 [Photobacterium damselae subsp. damselae]
MQLFYKYLPPERISYFDDERLRFSPPSALNDPYECIPKLPDELEHIVLDTIFEICETGSANYERSDELKYSILNAVTEICKTGIDIKATKQRVAMYKEDISKLVDDFNSEILKGMNENIGILSLSKRWNSSLMWSHYALSHQGICLGFNSQHDFFKYPSETTNRSGFGIGSVRYSLERPNLRGIDNSNALFTKSVDWKYEDEVRAICLLKDANKTIKAEPFNIALFKIPHQAVKEVIVGMRVDDRTYQFAKKFAMQNSIPLYRTMLSNRTYDLQRYQIDI